MGTQKPGEWASLVLTRFEDQVRELRRSACRVGLLFSLVSWPSSSPSSSLLVRLTPRYPLPVWLPPPPNVTSTMYSVSLPIPRTPPSSFRLETRIPITATFSAANPASTSSLLSYSLISPFSNYRISSLPRACRVDFARAGGC